MAMIGILGLLGSVISFAGSMAAAQAQKDQGEAERQAAYYKAQQEERRAMEERAVHQREALRKRKDTRYAQSTLQARAAASGAGAGIDDPSIISLASEVEQEGEYQALSQMWIGETRARTREDQATLDRYVGDQRKRAADQRATATIIGGIGGLIGGLGRGFGGGGSGGFG